MFPTAAISGSMKVPQNFLDKEAPASYCQTLTSGNFVIIVFLQGLTSDEEMELGRNVLSKIEEQANQSPEISPTELVEMQSGQFSTEVQFNLLVAKVEGQKLLLCGRGEVGAKIVRRNKLINLIEQGIEPGAKTVSGPMLDGDLLILGTSYLFSTLTATDFLRVENLSVEEIKEQFVSTVESANEKEKNCAVFMRVNLKNEGAIVEPVTGEIEPVKPPLPVPAQVVSTPVSGITVGKALWPSLGEFLSKKGQWIPRRQSFEDPKSRRSLYLVLVVFIVFISLIAFQLRSRNLETNAKNIATIEATANEGINSASKLIGLNDQIARDSLTQTRKDVEVQIEKAYGTDWKDSQSPDKDRLESILAKVDFEIGKVSHVYVISKLDTFYDFSLMKSGPKIASSNLHGGKIVALDMANGAIYSLMTTNKAAELVIGNNELKKATFLDFTPDTLFVQTPSGIFQKPLNGAAEFKQIVKPAEQWGDIRALSAFGGNLYSLDPKNNQIWKYQGTDLGFSELVNYIKTGLPVDISSGSVMQIDGFVYVLTNGVVARFAGGDISDFTLSGLPDPSFKTTSFFTSDETENVYLWDEDERKAVVVDKKGIYQAEYKIEDSEQNKRITTILADESVKKIFLLTDSQVFSIAIK